MEFGIVSGTNHEHAAVWRPLGPKPPGPQKAFWDACVKLSVLELGDEFATLDAGQAGSELLKRVQERPALKGKTEAQILTAPRDGADPFGKRHSPRSGSAQGIAGCAEILSRAENRKFTGEFH